MLDDLSQGRWVRPGDLRDAALMSSKPVFEHDQAEQKLMVIVTPRTMFGQQLENGVTIQQFVHFRTRKLEDVFHAGR